MLLFILIFTICFIIFIEWYFGSIIFRPDSSNNIVFNLSSLVNFLCHPFHNSFLWNPEVIIGNYPFMLFIGICIYSLVNKFDL
jgi:hypothetical protein